MLTNNYLGVASVIGFSVRQEGQNLGSILSPAKASDFWPRPHREKAIGAEWENTSERDNHRIH